MGEQELKCRKCGKHLGWTNLQTAEAICGPCCGRHSRKIGSIVVPARRRNVLDSRS